MSALQENIVGVFTAVFGSKPLLFRSPGRINIIGEHTDYNNGFVLPAAIDKQIVVGILPREDEQVHLVAAAFNEQFQTSLEKIQPVSNGWPNYVLGVIAQLQERGAKLNGFNLVMDGDVPAGSGLSSSAAVECAVAFALNELFQLGFNRMELAFIAQKAEHTYAGVMCGLMDQFASLFGKKEQVMRLDCKTLEYAYVPLELGSYRIILFNTNVKHSLASSAYNERRQQCEQGVRMVQQQFPEVESLRDVTLEQLEQLVQPADQLIYSRCRYVVEENLRLLDACEHLAAGDIHALGRLMYASHEGLSKAYEVSCPELDFLVENVKNEPSVLGARMMGGGFGGCTINLVQEDAVNTLQEKLEEQYRNQWNLDLTTYQVAIADGSSAV